jgi:hypothetical protein
MSTNPKSDYNKMKENVVIVDITSIINNISSVCKCRMEVQKQIMVKRVIVMRQQHCGTPTSDFK